MSHHTAILVMVAAGAQFSLQAPINSGLGRTIGGLPASMVSFFVGTVLLLVLVLATGGASGLPHAFDVPAYELLGGLLGALFVLAATIAVGSIGAGAVAAGIVTGQLIGSMALDQVGFLGLEQAPVTPQKVLAAVLLLGGTLLVVRRPGASAPSSAERRIDPRLGIGMMVAGGTLVAFQGPINAALAHSTGDLPASFVSFFTGTLILAAAVVATRQMGMVRKAAGLPWYYFLGGVIGTVMVTTSLLTVEIIGAKALTAAAITGQLATSLILDRIGFLGLAKTPLSAVRLAGVALLVAGTLLVV